LCVLNRQPTWAKITQAVHGKGQRAESKDQRADMSTDVLCVLTDTNGHTRTATDVLYVVTDTHRCPVCADGHPQTSCVTSVLISVLIDSHRRPVCDDGHTQTHTDSHRSHVCADGQPRTSSTDVLCVLTDTHGRPVCADGHPRTPRGPKSPEQSTGRVSVLSPRTNVLICVLMDSHGRHVCADGHTRTHTESHGRPVRPVCASHGQPRMSCVCWRAPTDVLRRGQKSPEQSTGRATMLSP
ncbi:unnamed protein product, partial [Brassica rapa]